MQKSFTAPSLKTFPPLIFAAPSALHCVKFCILLSALSGYLAKNSPLGLIITALLALFSLALLTPYALPELRFRHALKQPKVELTKYGLKSIISPQPNQILLGYGYEFTPSHTRALYEARKAGFISNSCLKEHGHGSPLMQLLNSRQEPLWFDSRDLNGHTMIFGTTGSGKTTAFALLCCQAVMRGEIVVVLDPKHDRNLEQHLQAVCKSYRHGYFRSFCPHSEHSCSFDLLAQCENANQIATRIVSQLQGSGSASSFKAYAHQALSVASKALILNRQKITPLSLHSLTGNLEALRRMLVLYLKTCASQKGHEPLLAYVKRVFNKSFPKYETLKELIDWSKAQGYLDESANTYPYLCDLLLSCYGDANYYAKITQGIQPLLSMLTSGSLSELLSSSHSEVISFSEVLNHGLVFYAALDTLSDPLLGQTLGRLMLSQLSALAGRRYQRGGEQPRVNVYIDEASEVVSEELVQLLNKARGAGFALTIATQTLADFEVRSQASGMATQILGNCNNLIALRVIDTQSRQAVCSRLPKTTILKRASSLTVSDASGDVDGMRDTVSRSLNEQTDPLFPEDALGLLPDLEFVAALSDGRCLKGYLPYLKS